jgi:hypothetical protein
VELVLAAALGADLALEGLDLLVDPGELGVDRLACGSMSLLRITGCSRISAWSSGCSWISTGSRKSPRRHSGAPWQAPAVTRIRCGSKPARRAARIAAATASIGCCVSGSSGRRPSSSVVVSIATGGVVIPHTVSRMLAPSAIAARSSSLGTQQDRITWWPYLSTVSSLASGIGWLSISTHRSWSSLAPPSLKV